MRAISVSETGDLLWTEAPSVAPGPAEILIDVKATAINRADLMQRKGLYPPPPGAPETMGLECAGIVAAVGSRRDTPSSGGPGLRAFSRVAAMPNRRWLIREVPLKIPDNLDF